jgi:hypothetical protein
MKSYLKKIPAVRDPEVDGGLPCRNFVVPLEDSGPNLCDFLADHDVEQLLGQQTYQLHELLAETPVLLGRELGQALVFLLL